MHFDIIENKYIFKCHICVFIVHDKNGGATLEHQRQQKKALERNNTLFLGVD